MKISFFYLNILAFILLFTAVKIEAAEVTAFKQTYCGESWWQNLVRK
ncbi:MAG: hypothetical protein ACYSTS_16835 [Planctomycetota bacterium]|jgi:hypothetical protein